MNEEELMRKKKQIETQIIIGMVLIGISFILFIPTMGVTVISFFIGGVICVMAQRQFEVISTDFKSRYVKESVQELIPSASFDATGGFYADEVLGTRILPKTDRFKSEDLLQGKLDTVGFRSADLNLENVHHDKNGTHTVTIFKGRIYRMDFPSEFKTNFVVLQPVIGLKWRFNDYEAVETESVDFNESLRVFAQDELVAREIITPPFMERLMELDRLYKDKIGFSFQGNHLYITIYSGIDHFDLRLFRPVTFSYAEEIKAEIGNIRTILEVLRLLPTSNQ
jgi:hypothetical protein